MKKPIPFGKYYLLDRIAVGGMAEIFKAKVIREEGAESWYAIKRILPSIAEDEEFVKMFIDEAKIAVQLTHQNIVPIHDIGKVGDAYFIAMEYVSGKDMRSTIERLARKRESLPVQAACYVVMKVCEGLDYAHNKKDAAGRELNLVHRDVSPQNVLVGYDGEVRLIDFGIAKAANKAAKTQTGILKGKFGYMSPEQVRGLPLDRRSDIFSTGIVLYEIVTGERLFTGESDFSILEKVKNVEIIPPSTYNKSIPEDLERFILKALSREVHDRYQTAIELHDDLQSFMYTHGYFFSRKDMAAYLRSVFAEEYEEELRETAPAGEAVAAPEQAAPPRPSAPIPRRISAPPPPPRLSKSIPPATIGGGTVPPPPPGRGRTSIPPPPPPKKTMIGMPAPAPVLQQPPPPAAFAQAAPVPAAALQPMQPMIPAAVPMQAPPPAASYAPSAPPAAEPPQVQDRFTYPTTEAAPSEGLSMEWEDDEMETQIYEKLPDEALDEMFRPEPAAAAPAVRTAPPQQAAAPVEILPGLMPPAAVARPKGVNIGTVLLIMAIGLVVVMGVLLVLLFGVGRKRATLVVVTEPREAQVKVDGVTVESGFPPTVDGLKPGRHDLVVSAESYETKIEEVTLTGGSNTHVVTLDRKKAAGTGFSLDTEPLGATVVVDNAPIADKTPVRVIDLRAGTHTIRVEKENYIPYTTEIQVREGEVAVIPKVVLSPRSLTASITSVPDGAKVYLVKGGERRFLGTTPYTGQIDPTGAGTIEVEKEKYKTWSGEAKAPPGRDNLAVFAQLEPGEGTASGAAAGTTGGGAPPKKGGGKKGGGKKGGGDGGGAAIAPSGGTGFLSVSTQPWTIVYIDGQKIRNTPLIKYPLSSGQHKVRLINTQFNINQSYTVIIVAGQDTKIIKNLAQ